MAKVNVGDKVRVAKRPGIFTYDFYAGNIGVVIGFLNDPKAANNGAALIEIENEMGYLTRPYINLEELTIVEGN